MDFPVSDQGEVWSEVARKLRASGTSSPTADATAFYERHQVTIEELLRPIAPVLNQVGAVIAIGNEVAGLEAFDHPETWQIMHRKVLPFGRRPWDRKDHCFSQRPEVFTQPCRWKRFWSCPSPSGCDP